MKSELKTKGVMTDEGLRQLRMDTLRDFADLESSFVTSSAATAAYQPENFVNGQWVQKALSM